MVWWPVGISDHPDQGDLIARVPNSVYALHYLSDKNWLVVGHNQDGVHFIDVKQRRKWPRCNSPPILFSTSSQTEEFNCSRWRWLGLYCWYRQHEADQTHHARVEKVRCIAIHPNKEEFAVGYSDNHIRGFSLTDFSMKYEWLGTQQLGIHCFILPMVLRSQAARAMPS